MTGALSTTGNVFAQVLYANTEFYAGIATYSATLLPNALGQFTGNSNTYIQVNQQNIDPQGASDYVLTADVGNDTSFYVDLGITNSQYNNQFPNNSLGTSVSPLDGYLVVKGSSINQLGGNLVIGTTSTQTPTEVRVIVGGINDQNVVSKFTQTGLQVNGVTTISSNSTTDALRITQVGTGNALLVEDSANPDSTPFVIDQNGVVGIGTTTPQSTFSITSGIGIQSTSAFTPQIVQRNKTNDTNSSFFIAQKDRAGAIVQSGDNLGFLLFQGYDGAAYISAASIQAVVDGAPGLNDMPGRLVFNTTSDGGSGAVERMRIRSDGNIGFGGVGSSSINFNQQKNITGGINAYAHAVTATVSSDVTSAAFGYYTGLSTAVTSFTVGNLRHYTAFQNALGAGSAITNQFGFTAGSSLIGATNNYGFYGDIASGTGRWNFYAAGTADNYFAGSVGIGTSAPNTSSSQGKLAIISNGVGVGVTSGLENGAAYHFATYNSNTATPALQYFVANDLSDVNLGNARGAVKFYANNTTTERMRIDSAGTVGIGVVPSAWGTTFKIAQVGTGSIFATTTNNNASFGSNIYVDSAVAVRYIATAPATRYLQLSGTHRFYSAPSGTAGDVATLTENVIINASGNVGIGTSSPAARLHLNSTGDTGLYIDGAGYYPALTFRSSAATGSIRNVGSVFGYDGAGLYLDAGTGMGLVFRPNGGSEAARIDSSGNVGIGTTSPLTRLDIQSTESVGQLRIVNTAGTAAANNDWRMAVGGPGNYEGYLKFGSGNFANSWVMALIPGATSAARGANFAGFVSSPSYNSFVTGRGDVPVLYWTNTGGNFNGTLSLGQNYPSGNSNVEVFIGPSSGTYTLKNNSNIVYQYTDSANGSTTFGNSTSYGRVGVVGTGTTSSTNSLAVHNSTGTNNALIVRDDGNVGIGTSTPSSKLEVNGTVTATAFSGRLIGPELLDDVSGLTDSVNCVFTMKLDGVPVSNTYIIDSKDLQVTVDGRILKPYVEDGDFIFMPAYNSYKGFRVRDNRVIIYNAPEVGSQIDLVAQYISTTKQIRRYPFSATNIGLGD